MGTTGDRPRNKVARLLEEYDLVALGDELESRWTATGDERLSLRDLADYFNRALLDAVIQRSDEPTLRDGVDATYRNLTSSEVGAGTRLETRSRLERRGIDVDALEADFVSYQAIRSYLTDYREATYEGPSDDEKIATDSESIQRLLSRTQTVIEDRVSGLRATDRIDLGEFTVLLDAQVLCQECGAQHAVGDLLEAGGCACQQDGE